MSNSVVFIAECILALSILGRVVRQNMDAASGFSDALDALRSDLEVELSAWQYASQEAWRHNLVESHAVLSSRYPAYQTNLDHSFSQLEKRVRCEELPRMSFTSRLLSRNVTALVIRGQSPLHDALRPNWHVRFRGD